MVKKGSVKRKKVEGMYLYKPAFGKSELERQAAAAVIKGIVEISPAHSVSAFVDILAEADGDKLEEFMRIIEERRKDDGDES
jgi:predicted transcriptional regulator